MQLNLQLSSKYAPNGVQLLRNAGFKLNNKVWIRKDEFWKRFEIQMFFGKHSVSAVSVQFQIINHLSKYSLKFLKIRTTRSKSCWCTSMPFFFRHEPVYGRFGRWIGSRSDWPKYRKNHMDITWNHFHQLVITDRKGGLWRITLLHFYWCWKTCRMDKK